MISVSLPTSFWKVFKLWAGLTALHGVLMWVQGMTFGGGLERLLALLYLLAPALVLGAIGASVMTFAVPPGRKLAALFAGIAVGFVLPVVTFWGLAAVLPKDEGSMGYVLAGWVFGILGGVAGIVAGTWRAAERRT
jgi:hypothetical protein